MNTLATLQISLMEKLMYEALVAPIQGHLWSGVVEVTLEEAL